MSSDDRVPITPELARTVADYARAKEARARWEAEEKRLKEEILDVLGFDPDDPKPHPLDVIDPISGVVMFGVKVGSWRGLNIRALKEERPDIYAMYETTKASKSIKV